ncbi:MAG: hypothetical protein NZ480_07320 [Bdellovibrionaceae bacterium]|nr:hypothetical protein [Pseudobdellovibrionaceae bacterium]MDW8190253.1 hypothetical protein [Pseudobdellovibrionaceae bacterium]
MIRKHQGSLLYQVVLVTIGVGISLYFIQSKFNLLDSQQHFSNRLELAKHDLHFALETLDKILLFAEDHYLRKMQDCPSFEPFFASLIRGHGCELVSQHEAFTQLDFGELNHSLDNIAKLFSWQIKKDSATSDNSRMIAQIFLGPLVRVNFSFEGYLYFSDALVLWGDVFYGDHLILSRRVAISSRSQHFRLHVESGNNSISVEKINPHSLCPSRSWTTYKVWVNNSCQPTGALGGGWGLTHYKGRFFGVQPYTGSVVDVSDSQLAQVVPETGIIGGVTIFPPYQKSLLLGIDDFEVVGDDQETMQFFYSQNQHIGLIYKNIKKIICDLSQHNLGVGITGLLVLPGSDYLIADHSPRIAQLEIKDDLGRLLKVHLRAQANAPSQDWNPKFIRYVSEFNRYFICFSYVQKIQPADEYQRTLGFTSDRTTFRRFFIY